MIKSLTRETLGGLPRPFWYVWTAVLLDKLGTFVFIYFTFYLTKVRGLSLVDTGLILSLIAFGAIAGNLVGGFLTDRWGRRPTAIVSSLCRAVLLLALGLTTSFGALAALVFAIGFAQSMFGPVMGAIVADLVPEKDRVRAYALNYWALNIAFARSCQTVCSWFSSRLPSRPR